MEVEDLVIQLVVLVGKKSGRWLSHSRQARMYMQSFSNLRESVCEQISICVAENVITEEILKFMSRIFIGSDLLWFQTLKDTYNNETPDSPATHAWHIAAKPSLCLALLISLLMQHLLWDFAFNFCLDNKEECRANDLCPVSLQSALFTLCGCFFMALCSSLKMSTDLKKSTMDA